VLGLAKKMRLTFESVEGTESDRGGKEEKDRELVRSRRVDWQKEKRLFSALVPPCKTIMLWLAVFFIIFHPPQLTNLYY